MVYVFMFGLIGVLVLYCKIWGFLVGCVCVVVEWFGLFDGCVVMLIGMVFV